MASRYLLDTNIASYIIKGNIPAVLRHLWRVPMAEVAISTVTEGELRYGVARKPGATQLQKSLRNSCFGSLSCPGTRMPRINMGIFVPVWKAQGSQWVTSI